VGWAGLGEAGAGPVRSTLLFFLEEKICVFDSLRKKEKEHVPTKREGTQLQPEPNQTETNPIPQTSETKSLLADRWTDPTRTRRRRWPEEEKGRRGHCKLLSPLVRSGFATFAFFRYSRRAAGGEGGEPIRRVFLFVRSRLGRRRRGRVPGSGRCSSCRANLGEVNICSYLTRHRAQFSYFQN
jgi:hypothetical protein